jgi:hypothetical protein
MSGGPTRPKDQGGLGITDLRAQNTTLFLKFLHKFYNRVDLPWVQLTWEAQKTCWVFLVEGYHVLA